MKKVRTALLMAVFSTALVGNAFASGAATSTALDLFSSAVEYVVSFFADDNCPVRQCISCRPVTGVDENGNCRPRD